MAFSTFTMLCNHHIYQIPEHFYHSERRLRPQEQSPSSASPSPRQPPLSPWFGLFRTWRRNETLQQVASCVSLLSLGTTFARFIHVAACVRASFFARLSTGLLCRWTTLLLLSTFDGHSVVSTFWRLSVELLGRVDASFHLLGLRRCVKFWVR